MLNNLSELYQRMGVLCSAVTLLIVMLFVSGFYINVLLRRRYISLSEELAAFCAGELDELKSEMLIWVADEYKTSLECGLESINTNSIIDTAISAFLKLCITGENYLKKVNGLLITMGLFGTFLGLISAIGNIGSILSNSNANTLITDSGTNTFQMLFSSFQGMSVAFITSLMGTGFSILFSFIMTFINSSQSKKLFITQLEEYLDIKVTCELAEKKLEQSKTYTDEVNILTRALCDSISAFDKSIGGLNSELQSLKNFNMEFGGHLDNAGKTIAVLCNSIDKQSEVSSQCSILFSECTSELKTLVKEIKGENRRLEAMNGLFSELSKKLDESTQDRKIFLKAIYEIPDRLLNYNEAAVAPIERGR